MAELAGLNTDMFTSGTDSALIGSIDSVSDGSGGYDIVQNEGLLAGKKCLNFDEGSILLQSNPKQFFSEVILYLFATGDESCRKPQQHLDQAHEER